MRSILPPTLVAAALFCCACDSQEDAPGEAAPKQDADAPESQEAGSEEDAAVPHEDSAASQPDAGASQHDAAGPDRDAGAPIEDAAQSADAETARDAAAPKPTLEELMQTYRGWSPQPSEPQAISVEIAGLCRLPSAAENAFVASEHGTDYRHLQNWLNPAAKRGFDDKRTPFEPGAAIVKEKLALESAGKYRLVARGLMIKRAPGFDPAHGDWEFGYWEPGKELRSGDQAARTCGGCHASANTDFVFLDGRWRFPL